MVYGASGGLAGCKGVPTTGAMVVEDSLSVGPLGRSISLAGGLVTLTVPEGAVSDVVTLTLTSAQGYPAAPTLIDGTALELGPPGITFALPVTVSIRYPDGLPAGIRRSELGFYEVVSAAWEYDTASTVDSSDAMVSGLVDGSAVFALLGAPIDAILASPANAALQPGGSVRIRPIRLSAAGDTLPNRPVTWSSSDPSVAQVDAAGNVTAGQDGLAQITLGAEGVEGYASIQVSTAGGGGGGGGGGNLAAACPAYPAPSVPAPLRTFYVDGQAGNDANDGLSEATAWKTLNKANNTAKPGDLFLLAGTFAGQLIRPVTSGTAANKITYAVTPGRTAALSVGQYDVIAWLDDRSHIVLDGLEFTNAITPIQLIRANNNWIRNVYVHDAGSVRLRQSSDNRIEDSRVERIGNESSNTGDNIFIQDGSNRNVVVRNTVAYGGHGTIWISYQSGAEATSDDNIIAHNDTYNPWASGIGLNGKANRTLVECNRIYNSADGSGANYPRDGLELEGTNNIIRYNEIFSNGDEGISIEGRSLLGFTQNGRGNHIYGNTVWGNGGGGLDFVQRDVGVVENNIVENNIFWNNNLAGRGTIDNGVVYAFGVDMYNANTGNVWPAGSAQGNILRNNIFDLGPQYLLLIRNAGNGGNVPYSLAQAQSTFAGWANAFAANPLLTDPTSRDFTLQAGSPAIDAGNPVSGQSFLGAAPDLGAHERQ